MASGEADRRGGASSWFAILVLAAALRIAGIAEQPIWLDEAQSWRAAIRSDWLPASLTDANPPLYYAILRVWIAAFGESAAALRALSVLEGTAFVAAVMWWGGLLFGRRAAMWTGLWAAVAPMAIYYSQEARAYAQLTLLLTLTYACIVKAVRDERDRWWWAATIAATAALYSHYTAAFALVFSAALVALGRTPPWRKAGIAAAAVILAVAPWLVLAASARRSAVAGLEWIAAVWQETPPSMAIIHSLQVLPLGGHAGLVVAGFKQLATLEFPQALHLVGVIGLLALAAVAGIGRGDETLAPEAARSKRAVALLFIGPLILLWAVSWVRPLYVVGRYDQVALPACLALLGMACAKLQQRAGSAACACVAALLLLPIGWKLRLYYDAAKIGTAASVAGAIDERARNADVVVFTELRALPVIYELSRLGYIFEDKRCRHATTGRHFACRAFPRQTEDQMAMMTGMDGENRDEVADAAADFAGERGSADNSVWVVLGRYRASPGVIRATPRSSALLERLEALGLSSVSADPRLGVLEYRRRKTD